MSKFTSWFLCFYVFSVLVFHFTFSFFPITCPCPPRHIRISSVIISLVPHCLVSSLAYKLTCFSILCQIVLSPAFPIVSISVQRYSSLLLICSEFMSPVLCCPILLQLSCQPYLPLSSPSRSCSPAPGSDFCLFSGLRLAFSAFLWLLGH